MLTLLRLSDANTSRTVHARPTVAPLVGITLVALLAGLSGLTGCSQVEPVAVSEPVTDPTQLYVRLELNHTAINLTTDAAVPAYSTLQLTATPYDGTGAAIADAPAPTFSSTDTSAVTVTPDGVLQGHRVADGVQVIATLTLGAVRHADTAVVNVKELATPPVLDTFSIHVPPDSAEWYAPGSSADEFIGGLLGVAISSPQLSPRAVDATGAPIQGLAIDYVSLDSAVAVVDRRSGQVTPIKGGHIRVVARTIAYGVAGADTMTYTVQPPFSGFVIAAQQGFRLNGIPGSEGKSATIVAGGIVWWISSTQVPMDVTFDDPTNVTAPPVTFCDNLLIPHQPFFAGYPPGPYCGVGNIAAFSRDPATFLSPDGSYPSRFRQFPVPGTYSYHSTATGATGQIVVLERTPPLP